MLEKTERIKELRKRWKEHKKWLFEATKKKPTHYLAYTGGELSDTPEIKEVLDKLYIPTETEFEKTFFREVRGDSQRENMLSLHALRKWHHIDVARSLSNAKSSGFGKIIHPNIIDEIFCKEAGENWRDINIAVFASRHHYKGIGEWKELTKEVRKNIPFPLVYRPIKDIHGYTILETKWEYGTHGRWECRPLHPSDAWGPWGSPLNTRLFWYLGVLLAKLVLNTKVIHFTSAGVVKGSFAHRPFDRWYRPSSLFNRILFKVFIQLAR